MKIITLTFFLFISLYGFSQVTLKGTILNADAKEVSIDYITKETAKKTAIKNGSFELNAKLKQGYYKLKIGSESTDIYLSPRDLLSVSLDAENFDETISFTGKGANRNNYLVKKFLMDEKTTENIEEFYEASEKDYLKNIIALDSAMKSALEKSSSEDFFVRDELKSLRYNLLFRILSFERLQNYYFGKKVKASSSFLAPLKIVNYDDQEEFDTQPYYRYLVSSKWAKNIEKAVGFKEKNQIFSKIKSNNIKIDQVISFYYNISKDRNTAQDYYDLIANNLPNSDFTRMAKEKLKITLKIKKGVKSPSFSFKDKNDKKYTLSDFKGKYVFLDIWATWCGPCIKQIPALKELEHLYKNKDIVFVSISVDEPEDYGKWKKMVAKKELGGIQLFADKAFESKFIKAYGISSIPRFILIDKEGKIYDENTDKPSTDLLKKTLESILN